MRITFLLPRYGWTPSGGFRVVYTFANLLVQRGHQVTVVHPRRLPPGGWPVPVGVYGRVHHAGGRVRDLLLRPSLAWARLDARVTVLHVPDLSAAHVPDADAVIATWWSTAEAALALPASRGERFHLVQGYETWNGAEDRVHAVLRAPIHKIVIARWLHDRLSEIGVPESLLTLVPIAIDHQVFRVVRPIGQRMPHVAMLYSSEPYKGGDIGIGILRRARMNVPELNATLFGVRAAPRDLPGWIRYVRNATAQELVTIYNDSSVYLCASLSEGWHLPPAEAMACGCALVSSDIGGVRDYAREDNAVLFPARDVESAVERLTALLHDPARRIRLAERGAETIRTFSWKRSAGQLAALLDSRVSAVCTP